MLKTSCLKTSIGTWNFFSRIHVFVLCVIKCLWWSAANFFYLYSQGILQSQGRILKKMRFMPSSLASNSHRLLTALVDSRHKKVYKVKNCITDIDPEREKEQKEKVHKLAMWFFFIDPLVNWFQFYSFMWLHRLLIRILKLMNFLAGRRRRLIVSIHSPCVGSANFPLVS